MPWYKQKPIFVVFEGGEGCGKTTQAHMLYNALKRAGRRVVYNDEPGSTKVGFLIREVLLGNRRVDIDPMSEFLLFEADRSLDFQFNILPWREEEIDIVQDRSFGSTFAYQGYARGLLPKHRTLMRAVDKAARRRVGPDLVFLLDGDPKRLLSRIHRSKKGAFEKERMSFHHAVRKGFLAQARADRAHWVTLPAIQPPATLHHKIWKRVLTLIA